MLSSLWGSACFSLPKTGSDLSLQGLLGSRPLPPETPRALRSAPEPTQSSETGRCPAWWRWLTGSRSLNRAELRAWQVAAQQETELPDLSMILQTDTWQKAGEHGH